MSTILVLGLGEGGGYLARALRESAGEAGTARVLAYDAAIGRPELAEGLRQRAEELGVELKEAPGPWIAEADLAVSLVPGTAALAVARSLRPHLRPGAVFADFNSITAEMMRAVAAVFEGSGIKVVDGGVLGNFRAGNRVPVLLAGEQAEAVAEVLPDAAFIAECIEQSPKVEK